MRLHRTYLLLFSAATFLTGCGFTADTVAPVAPTSKSIRGRIMGGQQPVAGSIVTVYALGTGGGDAEALASTTTQSDGSFAFNTTPDNSYTCPAGPIVSAAETKAARVAARGRRIEPTSSKDKITATGTTFAAKAHARPRALPDLTQSYVYVTAAGGDSGGGANSSILLAAGLGACADAQNETVEINEVSTVVFASAMENYGYAGGGDYNTSGSSNEAIAAMDLADTNTVQTFVDLSSGLVKPNVVSTEPGGTSITIEAAKIYTLANIIASCVNSADDVSDPANPNPSGACQNLYAELASTATNTLDAASQIAYAPYYNVAGLFDLATPESPFSGGLAAAPNDWTIGISYATNAMGLGLFAAADGNPTSSNIDIDSSGRVWFPSNKSGATGVGYFDPSEVAFNGPFGGTYLAQPQYVALDDPSQTAYVTDLRSNNVIGVDTTPGGTNAVIVTLLNLSDGFDGPQTPLTGPLLVNSDGTIDLAYTDTDGGHDLVYFDPVSLTGGFRGSFAQAATGLTLNTTLGYDPDDPGNPIAIAATSGTSTACSLEVGGYVDQGTLPSPLSTTVNPCVSGGAATGPVLPDSNMHQVQEALTTATTANEVCSLVNRGECFTPRVIPAGGTTATVALANRPMGVAFDGFDQVWLANAGDASIAVFSGFDSTDNYYQLSDRTYTHDQNNGSTMVSPTGIAIDEAGNIWVSNATCVSTTDTSCSFTLSEVLGAAYSTITPLSNQANQLQATQPQVAARAGRLRKKGLKNDASKAKVALGR